MRSLHKVLFDEVGVFDPDGGGSTSPPSETQRAGGRVKSKSVSATTLKAALKGEKNPLKRELVQLVLDWRNAETVPKRGGFVALGAKVADMPYWSSTLIPDHSRVAFDPTADPVLLIDGHYIVYRSFHAMPDLTAPDGTPVGALLGFCNVINKLVLRPWADGIEPRRKVVVAFDTEGDTFRHELYPGYKASRAEAPENLRPQFALIRSACEAYGLDTVEGIGFEADDVLASLALEAVTAGATNVTIASADKDLAQLVTRRVNMLDVFTNERLGPDEVLAKFLAPPGRLAELLAIAGDKSDDVIGVYGYGPVKAAKVLAKHPSLERAMDEICSDMTKKKADPALVEETRAQVRLARKLVELSTAVPVDRRIGTKSLESVRPFALQSGIGKGTSRLLEFMRSSGLPDLAERTAVILGVDATAGE